MGAVLHSPHGHLAHYRTQDWKQALPDLVIGPKADPLGNLPVLARLLGQDLLDLEGLVGRLRVNAEHVTSPENCACNYPKPHTNKLQVFVPVV